MSIRFAALSGLASLVAAGAASADVPRVATDIAPVHSLVARVMGDLGEPSLIVRPGSSPHAYALRPSEARDLQEADAVFWMGPALEPWLSDAIADLAPDSVVVDLLAAPGTAVLEFRVGATFAAHDHDHGDHDYDHDEHDHDHDHDGHDHDHDGHVQETEGHGGIDPHAWLDPENAKAWLDEIAARLGDLDAENADTYERHAARGKADIDAAVIDARRRLDPVSGARFVVFHDAYQYFETSFGHAASGAIAFSDASDPSAARIEEVRDMVRDLGVSCILAEPQFNPSLVRIVAEGTDAEIGRVDALGNGIALGPDFYPGLITTVAQEIASCAG